MYTGFTHLHVTVVLLFLLLYTIKTVLLLVNKTEQLDKLRAKSKIADMVLGSLMIITGGYLLFAGPGVESYHIVKIIVALASIPVGIIAFKKRNKLMAVVLLIAFLYVYRVAETKSLTLTRPTLEIPKADVISNSDDIVNQNMEAVLANGAQIYQVACVSCHGADGKLGVAGAKNLTMSLLTHQEKVAIITNGKGSMAPYKDQLSEQEIEAVASYVDSMKQ